MNLRSPLKKLHIPGVSAVGIRGSQYLEPGYIYVPYIPLETIGVHTGQRRLRATWTTELAQDLATHYGINTETELTTLLNDLVATQPLDLPQGNLFYFDYIYNSVNVYDDGIIKSKIKKLVLT